MIQINEYMLHSDITPFEGFELGRELFKDLNREHDLIDRDFRLFAEECDQMQGIQVITSADDSWGGFAAEYMAELGDEYGKIGTCTWGLERGDRVTRVSPYAFAGRHPSGRHELLSCVCMQCKSCFIRGAAWSTPHPNIADLYHRVTRSLFLYPLTRRHHA